MRAPAADQKAGASRYGNGMPRAGYVHEAAISLPSGGDERALGAAVTVALCGHWEHEGPCRWPHHTAASRAGGELVVRTLFASEPGEEALVRSRIGEALAAGELDGPGGRTSWTLVREAAGVLTTAEREHAERIAVH
jgi:hypothetical protein